MVRKSTVRKDWNWRYWCRLEISEVYIYLDFMHYMYICTFYAHTCVLGLQRHPVAMNISTVSWYLILFPTKRSRVLCDMADFRTIQHLYKMSLKYFVKPERKISTQKNEGAHRKNTEASKYSQWSELIQSQ